MSKLYQLSEQHRELQQLVDNEVMTLDDVADTFEGLEGQFNEKAVSLVHIINNMDSDTSEIDAEIKRLQGRKKTIENKQVSVREYLRTNMEASGITKIECPLFGITLAKGRDTVFIEDESKIPDELVDISVVQKPDKRKILAMLKAGEDVPGCRIEKTKQSLRIK